MLNQSLLLALHILNRGFPGVLYASYLIMGLQI